MDQLKSLTFGTLNSSSKYVKGKNSVLYWIAPERDPPECNNDKAKADDIRNFGICALELFHGGPPQGLLDGYENYITNPKRLSNEFRGMMMSCLRTNPKTRPMAEQLLSESFFKNRRNSEE